MKRIAIFATLAVFAGVLAVPAMADAAGYRYIATKCPNGASGTVKTWKSTAPAGQVGSLTYPRQTTVPCSGYKFYNGKLILWPEDWWKIDAAEKSAPIYWPSCSRDQTGGNVHQNGYYWVLYWIAC